MQISTNEFKQAIVKAHIAGQALARVPTRKYAQNYYRKFFLQTMGLLNKSPNKKLQTEATEPCTLQCVAPSKDCCDFKSAGCQWPR